MSGFFLFQNASANSGVFNVKDAAYGAVGDGSHDDTSAIRAAFTAMWANGHKGSVIYFPPGGYLVTGPIDISNPNVGSNYTSGCIVGAGKDITTITGTLNNDFIFKQEDGTNGPESIEHLSLVNASTWIASGALRAENTSIRIDCCRFVGMINGLLPFNCFDVAVNNCVGVPNVDVTTGTNGTLGIAGYSPHIKNWRSNGSFQVCHQVWGGNSCSLDGNGIENCGTAILLGPQTGWASSCTVSGNILTVSGPLGSSSVPQIQDGSRVYGRGLPLQTWGADPNDNSGTSIVASHTTTHAITSYTYNSGTGLVTLTMQLSQTMNVGESVTISGLNIAGLNVTAALASVSGSTVTYTGPTGQAGSPSGGGTVTESGLTGTGFAGTYRIDQSATISTPIPIWTRTASVISGCSVKAQQAEACYHWIYMDNVVGCVIEAGGCGSTPAECVDAFGNTGYTARVGVYLNKAGNTKLQAVDANSNAYLGSFYIDPNAIITNVTFDSCGGQKQPDAITDAGATISNGAGGSGTVLTVNSNTVSGSFIGIGMGVTGTGVTGGTTITGNHASDNTLTGSGGAGTYRVNNAHNLSARAFTITTGPDWVMPTATSSKAGLKFVNCGSANLPAGYVSGLNSLGMTFTCLPGQAGASNNMPVIEGQEFYIVDGAKSGGGTALPGDATQGGGTQKIYVFWNGTSWIRK